MVSSNSELGSVIAQLHSQSKEVKEAFDQAFAELEQQKAENDKRYQEQLEQLKEERRKWDEEKATMEKIAASASSIVELNVGGENMSTSRATLTLVDGSLLATMFSGKSEDKLRKDAAGRIFLDRDPVLFKYLLNQLRIWSNSSVERVFSLPVGSEQPFLQLVRSLNFGEGFIAGGTSIIANAAKVVQPEQQVKRSINVRRSIITSAIEVVQPEQKVEGIIDGETSATTSAATAVQPEQKVEEIIDSGTNTTISASTVVQPEQKVEGVIDGVTSTTSTPTVVQPEQKVECFRAVDSSGVRLTDNNRSCEKINSHDWQCVFGILNYSTGVHQIRLKLEKGSNNIFIGICSQDKLPSGPYFYDKPTTHGWLTHGYVVTNGQNPKQGWSAAENNDILELTINCDERSLSILNEKSQVKNSMQVDINQAPFPWCLLVLLNYKDNRVSLV